MAAGLQSRFVGGMCRNLEQDQKYANTVSRPLLANLFGVQKTKMLKEMWTVEDQLTPSGSEGNKDSVELGQRQFMSYSAKEIG